MRSTALLTLLLLTETLSAQSGPADSAEEMRRAGMPLETSRWAKPSDTGRYGGYLVGGGNWTRRWSEAPTPDEGTWGWDYFGGLFRRNVNLGWWHGRRAQGGTGAYGTEGPRILPEVEK